MEVRTVETDESSGDDSAIMLLRKWDIKQIDDDRKSPSARRELEDLRRIRLIFQEKSSRLR